MHSYQEEQQRLCQAVTSTKQMVQEWASTHVLGQQDEMRRHELAKRVREEEAAAMKENFQDLERAKLREEELMREQKQLATATQREVAECIQEHRALGEEVEKGEAKRARMDERFEERRKQAQREEAAFETRRRQIDSYLGLFAKRLGLSLAVVPPRSFRFAFTLLSEECPNKVHAFTLTHKRPQEEEAGAGAGGGLPQQAGGYMVSDCNPLVEKLDTLLEELNVAPEQRLPSFICGMRKAFQEQLRERDGG